MPPIRWHPRGRKRIEARVSGDGGTDTPDADAPSAAERAQANAHREARTHAG